MNLEAATEILQQIATILGLDPANVRCDVKRRKGEWIATAVGLDVWTDGGAPAPASYPCPTEEAAINSLMRRATDAVETRACGLSADSWRYREAERTAKSKAEAAEGKALSLRAALATLAIPGAK